MTETDTDCWEWHGPATRRGYGIVRSILVHRTLYELMVGEIPEGLQLDHLCRNRRCANPTHLEPVTAAENNRRARNTEINRCLRGHAAYVFRSNGRRRCVTCERDRERARVRVRSRRREAA